MALFFLTVMRSWGLCWRSYRLNSRYYWLSP